MKNIPTPDTTNLFGTPITQLSTREKGEEQSTSIMGLAAQWLTPATKEHMKQRIRSSPGPMDTSD